MSVYKRKYQGGGRSRRTITPQGAVFQNPLITGEDAFAMGLKSLIPISELIGSNNRLRNLRKQLPTKFSRVNFTAPVVRDMIRPSFATPTRPPLGSSLAEHVAGQKFSDAYQNAQEANFEIQNQMQKRQQEAANIGLLNQEEAANVDIANREAQLRTMVDLEDYKYNLGRRDAGLGALNYYLATDPNMLVQSRHMRQMGRDNYIVQNPEKFGGTGSKQYKEALMRLRSIPSVELSAKQQEEQTPGGRSGRKLKTRFSYGR